MATSKDTMTLIMVLQCKISKEFCCRFDAIIEKFIKMQHDPISGTTTEELQAEPVEDMESHRMRIKRGDLALANLEIQKLRDCMSMMTTVRPDWMQADVRLRLQTEDMIKNLMTRN